MSPPTIVPAPQIAQLSPVKGKGKRKRTLTLVDGSPLATSPSLYPLPSPTYLILLRTCICFPQIMEAMRLRIIQLEEELAQRESGASQTSDARPAKRARVDNEDASASASTPSAATASASTTKADAATAKADAKKRKMQFKTFFDRLKKELKSDAVKFQGKGPKTIKFDEVLAPADFEGLFGGKGTLIQPTPQNKPKSTVTIISYTAGQVADLFEGELKALKGNRWTVGGLPTRNFGGGFFGGGHMTMSKSRKTGACDVNVLGLEVSYSKNNMKCTLKFDVNEVGGGSEGYEDDWWAIDSQLIHSRKRVLSPRRVHGLLAASLLPLHVGFRPFRGAHALPMSRVMHISESINAVGDEDSEARPTFHATEMDEEQILPTDGHRQGFPPWFLDKLRVSRRSQSLRLISVDADDAAPLMELGPEAHEVNPENDEPARRLLCGGCQYHGDNDRLERAHVSIVHIPACYAI
ncbi:uncharacterized protein SCHCODRAFT_02522123 [Schizophyllum commune H4-8]|nr:uncharacterized protein SCHCODRAFT_02522123 [Schizophyllum commune H4-8]KAI5836617.1 hypothetical protein SCHCODRAFT_02522123 [Schizophyllum commune H4-8]